MAGVEASDTVAVLGRDRVHADLPGHRRDRQAGAARGGVLGRRALSVADRPLLVDRPHGERLRRRQDLQLAGDDGRDVPDVSPRADGHGATVRAAGRRRLRARAVLHLLGHGHAGADRLLRRRTGLLRHRPTARRGDTLEHRRSGRHRGRDAVHPGRADHRSRRSCSRPSDSAPSGTAAGGPRSVAPPGACAPPTRPRRSWRSWSSSRWPEPARRRWRWRCDRRGRCSTRRSGRGAR